MSHLQRDEQNTDYLRYSMIATQELQKQLNDPHACMTIEAIVAVLGFASCAVRKRSSRPSQYYLAHNSVKNMVGDMTSAQVHMDGLSHILQRRGGLQTVDSDPLVRIMLFW